MNILEDSFGRKFPYIRLSITDVCNFKCGYCLPNGYQKDKSDNRKFLSVEEIDSVFGKILKEIRTRGVREIKAIEIGEIMMNALKEVDSVAYVRFASVYRDFQDIKDFSEEINSLNKESPKNKKSKK